MQFTVIIPVFNEEKTIGKILDKILSQKFVSEIIVVDDGSTDKTPQILKNVKNPKIKLITHNRNMGKGAALQSALVEVSGDYLIIQDADLEYDPSQYSLLLPYARPDTAVYGSRLLVDTNKHAYLSTYLGNIFVTWVFNRLFNRRLTDTYTCYKLLPSRLTKSLDLSSNSFAIEAEITGKLAKKGIKIVEVPIKFFPRTYGQGKKIKAKDALIGLWTFLKIRLKMAKTGRIMQKIPIIAILLLGAFLRFYRLPEMGYFDFDQEYAVNFAYRVVHEFPVQMIGQELSVQGLFMGPLYFYYLTPFFLTTGLHPIGGYVGSVVLGLVIIITYFWVGKALFGTTAGLVASFLRSLLFIKLEHDWSMTPAYSSELLVLITWFCFYKYWQGNTKILPVLGFAFGLYTSIHPILFPFYLVFVILFLMKRVLPNLKNFVISFVAFLVPISPLLVFEYFHNFLEVKRFISLFSGSSIEVKDISHLAQFIKLNLSDLYNILALQFISFEMALLAFLVIIIFLIVNRVGFWRENFHFLLLVAYAVFVIYYAKLPVHVPEYYFLALWTLALLYTGGVLSLLAKKNLWILLVIILANITFSNFRQLTNKWNNPSLITLYHKNFIVKEIVQRQPDNQEFYVSYIAEPGWNFGFNYLFKYYGHQPQSIELKPPIYTIVIPKFLSPQSIDIGSGNIGVILPD